MVRSIADRTFQLRREPPGGPPPGSAGSPRAPAAPRSRARARPGSAPPTSVQSKESGPETDTGYQLFFLVPKEEVRKFPQQGRNLEKSSENIAVRAEPDVEYAAATRGTSQS